MDIEFLKKAPPRLAGHTLNHTKPKSLFEKTNLLFVIVM